MRIEILTLFPEMFTPLGESIVKRAVNSGVASVGVTNIRDYAHDKHQIADDRPYGGGAGMVMKPEPIYEAVTAVRRSPSARVIFTSPQGRLFDQELAQELADEEELIIVCGHYEGIDERAIELLATDVISVGDFVLTGGELPAMIITDAVIRLLPGALGDDTSSMEESFSEHLLEYPHYTRPPVFMGQEVPEVLLSGNHANIAKWRRELSVLRTASRRPDLLEKADLTDDDLLTLDKARPVARPFNLYLALVHYPVYNKKRQIVNTSFTNLDLHDIARAARVFEAKGYYIIQPARGQDDLINSLLDYWLEGAGVAYNPDRAEALSLVRLAASVDEVIEEVTTECGRAPKLIATSARSGSSTIGYKKMRRIMEEGGDYLLLLGTGWGLADELTEASEYLLRPVYGRGAYNHLSVRSAASIILDRLLGEKNSR